MEWLDQILEETGRHPKVVEVDDRQVPIRIRPAKSSAELLTVKAFVGTNVVVERDLGAVAESFMVRTLGALESHYASDEPAWVTTLKPDEPYDARKHRHQNIWMLFSFLREKGPVDVVIGAYDSVSFKRNRYAGYWIPASLARGGIPTFCLVDARGQTAMHRKHRDLALPLVSYK